MNNGQTGTNMSHCQHSSTILHSLLQLDAAQAQFSMEENRQNPLISASQRKQWKQ